MTLGFIIAFIIGGICVAGMGISLWYAVVNFTRKGWEHDALSGVLMLFLAAVMLVALIFTIGLYQHETGPTFELLKSEWTCTASHEQTDLVPTKVGDVTTMMPVTSTVCDTYRRR